MDANGGLLAEMPAGSFGQDGGATTLPLRGSAPEPRIVFSPPSEPQRFLTTIVPIADPRGDTWAYAVTNASGRNSRSPFDPAAGMLEPDRGPAVSQVSNLHLEVMALSGMVVLGVGPDEDAGATSPHYAMMRDWISAGTSGLRGHHPDDACHREREHRSRRRHRESTDPGRSGRAANPGAGRGRLHPRRRW